MRKNEPLINRRDFLKLAGLGGGAGGWQPAPLRSPRPHLRWKPIPRPAV
ncbi:MAG: twin-arginine translocation signal domain-containing protein [Anaerolineales bacterium]